MTKMYSVKFFSYYIFALFICYMTRFYYYKIYDFNTVIIAIVITK